MESQFETKKMVARWKRGMMLPRYLLDLFSRLLTRSLPCFLSLSLSLSRQTNTHTQIRGPGVSDSNDFVQVLDDAITAVTKWISGEKRKDFFCFFANDDLFSLSFSFCFSLPHLDEKKNK